MAFDYKKSANKAKELLKSAGMEITLNKVRARSVSETVKFNGLVIGSGGLSLGDTFEIPESVSNHSITIIGTPWEDFDNDLNDYDEVLINNLSYKITASGMLQPTDIPILIWVQGQR